MSNPFPGKMVSAMLRSQLTPQPIGHNGERGAVLLEWAIVAFGVIIGLFMLIDFGNMLLGYKQLSQAAFEGVVLAGSYPGLEATQAVDLSSDTGQTECASENAAVTTFPCGHFVIQERMRLIAKDTAILTTWSPPVSELLISSQYIARGSGGGIEEGTVTVSLVGTYQGFVIRQFPISVSLQGPYLYGR